MGTFEPVAWVRRRVREGADVPVVEFRDGVAHVPPLGGDGEEAHRHGPVDLSDAGAAPGVVFVLALEKGGDLGPLVDVEHGLSPDVA